jgi:hypothetical protein
MVEARFYYKKNSGQSCFLCDEIATSGDHVPPLGLFPTSIRGSCKFLEVPACQKHNHGSTRDDEYFRLVLATASSENETALKLIGERVLRRGKNGRLRSQLLLENLRRTMKPILVKREYGLLEEMHMYEIDRPRFQAIVDKIVRGLFWHHNGHRVANGYYVTPYLRNIDLNDQHRKMLGMLPIFSAGHPSVFEYRYWEADVNDKNKIFVGMSFYGASNLVFSTLYPEGAALPTDDEDSNQPTR